MAYDETFQALPRFTPQEVSGVSVPEVMFGQLRPLKNILRLSKVKTSPTIEAFIQDRALQGDDIVPRVSHNFLKTGQPHAVAWVGRVGIRHEIVCDCIGELDNDLETYEENVFACEAVHQAIRFKGQSIGRSLSNENFLHSHGDYETVRGMIMYLLGYSRDNPDVWLANHKSGEGVVGGLAQTLGRPYEETRGMVEEMEKEGLVVLGGQHRQVVALTQAA